MNKTTKIILGIVVLVIIVVLVAVFYKPAPKEAIKIGAILPLTGSMAYSGESLRDAILLAQSQLPKESKYTYEVIFEDDALDPVKASTAINKLINIDKVDAVISTGSGSGNVISSLTQQNKVIHFGVTSDLNVAKGEFNFIHWTPPESQAKKFVEEIKNRGIKKLAFIGVQHEGTKAKWEKAKEELNKIGIEVVTEEWFPFGTRDFKTIILRAKQVNPDIVMIQALSPELEIFAKQAKELDIGIPLTTIEAFEYTKQPELFEGYWYIQAAEPTDKFTTEYITKYNDIPKLGSPYAYDSFNLIVEGFERVGKNYKGEPTPETIVQELLKIKDFLGAAGTLTMKENGIIWSDAVVKMIKNGKPVIIND